MKKIVLLLCMLAPVLANAQEPERKAKALIHKETATWCPYCGSWGWDLKKELLDGAEFHKYGLFMTLYSSGSSKIYSPLAARLVNNFHFKSEGIPAFGINGRTKLPGSAAQIYLNAKTFADSSVVVSAASRTVLSGGEKKIHVKIRFWEEAEGEYYIAAYALENGISEIQASRSGKVLHNAVLRGSLSSGDYGIMAARGQIEAGREVTHTFDYKLESGWNADSIIVYTVIWKKDGGRYYYVNGAENYPYPASVTETADAGPMMEVYPNPASGIFYVRIEAGAGQDPDTHISIINLAGSTVYRTAVGSREVGSVIPVPTGSLAPGVYYVQLKSGTYSDVRKIVIAE